MECVEAIQWMADLIHKHKVAPSRAQTAQQNAEDMFTTGKIAMYMLGRWCTTKFRTIKNFKWDCAPLPKGQRRATLVYSAGWAISKDSKHPEEAWGAVKFFAGKEAQQMASAIGHDVPVLKSVANSEYFIQPDELPENDKVFIEAVPYSSAMPQMIKFHEVWSVFWRELELVWLGKESAEKVCKKIVPQVNEILQNKK